MKTTNMLSLPEDKIFVVDAWEKFGGGFVSSLAVALRRADPINTMKILNTFENYIYDYYDQIIAIKNNEK